MAEKPKAHKVVSCRVEMRFLECECGSIFNCILTKIVKRFFKPDKLAYVHECVGCGKVLELDRSYNQPYLIADENIVTKYNFFPLAP